MMTTLVSVPLVCWLCALVARPRKPLPGNQVQELVYSRLLGRHQWLMLLAIVLTAAAFLVFVLTLSRGADLTLRAVRDPQRVCLHGSASLPTCFQSQPDGTWAEETLQQDGAWLVVATMTASPSLSDPVNDPAPSVQKR